MTKKIFVAGLGLALVLGGSVLRASPESEAAFVNAKARWDQESAKFEFEKKSARGRHDKSLLVSYLRQWPRAGNSDQAFLMLIEDGFCATWAGYPDCGVIEISAYEQFLSAFPTSEMAEQVKYKMAEDYYQMAWLWTNGKGVHNERYADLFRAQCLTLCRELKDAKDPAVKAAAAGLELKTQNNFSRPIAPMPPRVLQPDYY